MAEPGSVDEQAARSLEAAFSGEVLLPDAPGFDDVRQVYNGLIDKRPALIARAKGAADASAAIRFAREHGLEISIRGGGTASRVGRWPTEPSCWTCPS